MNIPEKLATLGTQDEDKQNKTFQRNWQHWVNKTKTNKTKHSRETGNIGYTRRRQTKQNIPEKLATLGTQDEDKQNKTTT
jgi:hypothetical protein